MNETWMFLKWNFTTKKHEWNMNVSQMKQDMKFNEKIVS